MNIHMLNREGENDMKKKLANKLLAGALIGGVTISLSACGAQGTQKEDSTAKVISEKKQQTEQKSRKEKVDVKNAVLNINGTLYYGTEETGVMGDSGMVAGIIASSVDEGEMPKKNGESNFGCIGNSYTRWNAASVMVDLGDDWYVFQTKNADAVKVKQEKDCIRLNGVVYYGTGKPDTKAKEEDASGKIMASVGNDELPEKDEQSNFGCIGNGYIINSNKTVSVHVGAGEEWYVFEAE